MNNGKNKPLIIFVLSLIILAIFSALLIFVFSGKKVIQENRKVVSASFYPLYFFTSEITGNKMKVYNITPAGAEPHDFEPTTKDLSVIEKSDLLILNGNSFEPWSAKVKNILKGKNTLVLEVSEKIAKQEKTNVLLNDPHIWLDPNLAKLEVGEILNSLAEIDSQNIDYYKSRAENLIMRLSVLDGAYKTSLTSCRQKTIVSSHKAFGYLARRYGFKEVAIFNLSPDIEPSSRQIAQITDFVRINKIKYILSETLVSPKTAQAIASETGAEILQFNPIEGLKEDGDKEDYFSLQIQNINSLKLALECL